MRQAKEIVDRICKEFADQGKLIEAGWIALRLTAIPDDASALQLNEMRMAYFAGAQHLFSSIMGILEPDAEPTETDLRRMDLIDKELRSYIEEFKLRTATTKGTA